MSTNVETQALPVMSVGGAFPILPPVNRWDAAQASGLSPLQLLAYRIARLRGLNVDQPRNLAKTVTVE